MKYVLRLRARPEKVSIAEKHQRLVSTLKRLGGPFGLSDKEFAIPECGEELTARFDIGRELGKGINGFVSYRYRGGLRDHGDCDDLLDLEFAAKKVDYELLLTNVVPKYVEAFQPYYGFVGDEEFTYIDFDRSRNKNPRLDLIRFYPVAFYGDMFCREALGILPAELTRSVADLVSRIQEIEGGVLIVVDDKPLSLERAEEFEAAIRKRLSINLSQS